MKNQAFIKTGMLPLKKVNRKLVADKVRKKRNDGFKFKRIAYDDAIAYQSNDKYDPYLYGWIK